MNTVVKELGDLFQVTPLNTGAQLKNSLRAISLPDLYLVDAAMDAIDTYSMLAEFRRDELFKHIPVMILAGYGHEGRASACVALGLADFLTEPYHASLLVQRIHGLLASAMIIRKAQESLYSLYDGVHKMIELRDPYTGKHVRATKSYMRIFIEHLPEDIHPRYHRVMASKDIIALSAQLHDMGKIAIHNCILSKGGDLLQLERKLMQTHVEEGVKAIDQLQKISPERSTFLEIALVIAGYHHCYWGEPLSGKGKERDYCYPKLLRGDKIPLEARMMAIVDVYEALRSQRSYKAAMAHDAACSIIEKNEDNQFDPKLVEVFKAVKGEFEKEFERISKTDT